MERSELHSLKQLTTDLTAAATQWQQRPEQIRVALQELVASGHEHAHL